jgi:antitoxin component of MazEF toxin-antitoxin module
MQTAKLRKWGGSIALPIPPSTLKTLGLEANDEVSLEVSDGRLMVARARKFTFEELLAEHRLLKLAHDRKWLEFPSLPSEEP